MRRLALALGLLLAAGCAGAPRRAPTAEVPPAPPARAQPAPTTPPAPGPVSAPWDTAGTAAARAARRNHAYPRGPNALGQKLVLSLPDPASLARGAETGEGDQARPAAETPKPSPPPANDRACWEVQVLVTTNRDRAKQEAEHIQKVLNLSAWVVDDGAIHRVRAGGCLTADGASQLADRLRQQGYPEAFRTTRQP